MITTVQPEAPQSTVNDCWYSAPDEAVTSEVPGGGGHA